MKRSIYPKDFAPYYPKGIQPCPMYVEVANRIYERLKDIVLELPFADELKKEIAVCSAIYFEDKVSDIGLWNAFVAMHQRSYSCELPFVEANVTLTKDDVDWHEVSFLVWLILSRNFENRFLNPIAMGVEAVNIIMSILAEDDEVEENDELYDFIYNKTTANDYFRLKHVLIWLRRSYLLCSPLSEERLYEYEDQYSNQFCKSESSYYAETNFIMDSEIGPMAEAPHLWLAEMYADNGMQVEADKLRSLKYCQQDIFEVVDSDSRYAVIKDSKDKEYKLKNVYPDVFYKGSFVYTALVKYADNDWEINGVIFNSNKKAYDELHKRKEQLAVSYERAYPMYMERTKNQRLSFFENTDQLKDWLKMISPELDLSEVIYQLPRGQVVAFISKKSGIIFAPDLIHVVKSSDNPYYGKCDAQTMRFEAMNALINFNAVHPELLHYLIDNSMLQDGDLSSNNPSAIGKEVFTKNLDFIARNHRRHYYHEHDY